MPFTSPGTEIWENAAVLTTAGSPYLTGFYDTTGYTNIFLECVITTAGTVTFTIEGSFDGSTLDATMPYTPAVTASSGVAGTVFAVQHPYIRFRVVVITSNPTVSTFSIKARA